MCINGLSVKSYRKIPNITREVRIDASDSRIVGGQVKVNVKGKGHSFRSPKQKKKRVIGRRKRSKCRRKSPKKFKKEELNRNHETGEILIGKRTFKMRKAVTVAGGVVAATGLSYIAFKLAQQNYRNLLEYFDERGREWYYFWTTDKRGWYDMDEYVFYPVVREAIYRHTDRHFLPEHRYLRKKIISANGEFEYGFWKLKLKKDEFESIKLRLTNGGFTVLKNLPNISSSETCSICFEDLAENVRVLACGHKFHDECIGTWKSKQSSCPLCRAPIKPLSKTLEVAGSSTTEFVEGIWGYFPRRGLAKIKRVSFYYKWGYRAARKFLYYHSYQRVYKVV